MKRRAVLAMLAAGTAGARAAAVGAALDRPSVRVRDPSRSVFAGATLVGKRIVAVGERGLVVVSDDGGSSWRQADVPIGTGLTAVAFADRQRGYCTGHGGAMLGSVDGGMSWRRLLDGRQIAALSLEAARKRGDEAALRSAERLVADGPDKPLLDLVLDGPDHVLAVGAFGLLVRSADGGRTWNVADTELPNPKALHLYACRLRGRVLTIAGEQGLLIRSEDGGRSFRSLKTPYAGSFFTLETPSDNELIVAGLRGNVWRSLDSGASWQQIRTPVPASIVSSVIQPDKTLLLASQAGLVLQGRGDALTPLALPPLPPLTGALPLPDGDLLALTVEGIRVIRTRPT